MIKKPFKDIELSLLGMGNMRLPIMEGGKDKDIDYEKASEIIDICMKSGINYYDTAHVYHGGGASEKFLGDVMTKYPRDSYYLATKFNIGAEKDYKKCFEAQLERMKTDHIDFYLIHCILDNNMQEYIDSGAVDYFIEQQKAGRITYLGFSSHASVQTLEKFASLRQWDFAQIQLNYFDWMYGNTKKEYEILASRNIPVIAMESVRGGRLASLTPDAEKLLKDAHPDWSIASWAFRWLMRLPALTVSLSGMTTKEQAVDNIKTFENLAPLTDEEEKLLFKACDIFHEQVQVPCTACRYCTDGCPVQINIPEILKVYNQYKLQGDWALQGLKNVKSEGMPKDCVQCGACTGHCPQNIDVPAIMAELGEKTK
ncbi:MAG: aldo/keto reductase [Treponema sp.]|nr:aldo/keto reductase [Treponema sp.]